MRSITDLAPSMIVAGSILPLAFIFLAPMLGLDGKLVFLVVVLTVFVCHLILIWFAGRLKSYHFDETIDDEG
ncbi:MAG: hypothetical protein J5I65_11695 [Aridibacter famidurans]|nr:hypothetical protein [Aridibacter famidurans]